QTAVPRHPAHFAAWAHEPEIHHEVATAAGRQSLVVETADVRDILAVNAGECSLDIRFPHFRESKQPRQLGGIADPTGFHLDLEDADFGCLDREPQPLLAFVQRPLSEDAVGRFGRCTIKAFHIAGIVSQWRPGKSEPADRPLRSTADLQWTVHAMLSLPRQRRLHQRLEIVPYICPDLPQWPSKSARVLGAEDRNVAVIVERHELWAPGDIRWLSCAQHELNGCLERVSP